MLTGLEPKAPTKLLAGDTFNQRPPERVEVVTLKDNDPPPAIEPTSVRVLAPPFTTNEKVIDDGFTVKLGWPADVTVSDTLIVREVGLAFGDRIVTLPW